MDFIKWLQARLNVHGASIRVDGDWGRGSIDALKSFQKKMGLTVSGVADQASVDALKREPEASLVMPSKAPIETMPPWMAELHRKMGLNEVRDNAALTAFLKVGRFLGNPRDLPWCGDAIESVMAKTLPAEKLPSNPFFAQAWAKFGIDVKDPIVGSIGVIKWSPTTGHVGIVAGVEGNKVVLLGGNQSNSINLSSFGHNNFMAFRWPSTFPIKAYPALRGKATSITNAAATR